MICGSSMNRSKVASWSGALRTAAASGKTSCSQLTALAPRRRAAANRYGQQRRIGLRHDHIATPGKRRNLEETRDVKGNIVERPSDQFGAAKPCRADPMDADAGRRFFPCHAGRGLAVKLAAGDHMNLAALPGEMKSKITQYLAGCRFIRMKIPVYENDTLAQVEAAGGRSML